MSAVPVFIPPVPIPPVAAPPPRMQLVPAPVVGRPATSSMEWQLTDRGIAIVLLFAAMILTAAVITIGVTAVRVTSTDHNAGLHGSSQTQR
jgi:hypothetical protein